MTSAIKFLVCGVFFGIGVKGGMELYDYVKSGKAKEHYSILKEKTTNYMKTFQEPKPE